MLEQFNHFFDQLRRTLYGENPWIWVLALLGFTVGWLALKLINALEDVAYAYYAEEKHNPFRERKIKTQLQFVKRILTVVIFLIVLASILLTFREVRQAGAAILTSAGVAGIVIGVAAQKSLANLVAGLQIAITQPIKIDDAVIVEGEWGIIEEITLTYVVVKIWDKRRIVLPITYFIQEHHPEALPKNRVAVAGPPPSVPASQPANHTVATSP